MGLPFAFWKSSINTSFEFSVDTTQVGTSSTQFQLPLSSSSTPNFVIDWGDGNSDTITTYNQAETLHTYSVAGTYNISIDGVLNNWVFAGVGDDDKILDISNWGTFTFSASKHFQGCSNLTVSATDSPIITNLGLSIFNGCSSIITMDVSNWDTSNATGGYFAMYGMANLTTFNCENWDTSNFTSLSYFFGQCNSLVNVNVSNWDVTGVSSTVRRIFGWSPTGGVKNTTSFAGWNINGITNFDGLMLASGGMTTANYDATLISWAAQNPSTGEAVHFGGSTYTLGGTAEAAKNTLINTYGWIITDGGGV